MFHIVVFPEHCMKLADEINKLILWPCWSVFKKYWTLCILLHQSLRPVISCLVVNFLVWKTGAREDSGTWMRTGTVFWENKGSENQACGYLSTKNFLVVTGNIARHCKRIVLTVKLLAWSLACVGLSQHFQKRLGQSSGLQCVLGSVPLSSLHMVNLFWTLRDISVVNLGPLLLVGLATRNILRSFNFYMS